MKDIEEVKVGSGTAIADKSAEKSAQISLKMIQLRMKQNKERAALAAQKKALQKEETMNVSFSPSQIAALKAEYSKINRIDPASDTYKKLIAMLDRIDLKSLQSLAAAELKFVSKLAQNRVMRKSMKKEDVQLDEKWSRKYKDTIDCSNPKGFSQKAHCAGKKKQNEEVQLDELSTNKLADYKKKAGENASAADKAGDTKTGNKRFSGIMKATRKQFDNDTKQKTEELSPKQKAMDKNKNGKIDGSDLAKLRGEELSPAQKALDKNKNGKIDGSDLAAIRNKKKQPQGADFAAQRRKERMASNGRMDEAKSDYEVYHKDYSTAVQTAIKQAEKRGYEVDMDDWHDKVATGPKKPSAGKTNSFSVKLKKDGKESKKALHLQVYNMDNHKYELNMYIEEIQLDELNKDTLHSYAKKSEKDQDDQYNKIGKGIRDKDPKSANKAGHKFSMRSIGQNRAEKRLAKEGVVDEAGPGLWANIQAKRERIKNGSNERMRKPGEKGAPESDALDRARGKNEAASPAQQAAIAIAMKKDGKQPKNMEESGAYDKDVKPSDKPHDKEAAAKRAKLAALAARKKMAEGIVDKIKAIKRGMQAKAKADDHFDKAGDPKNANASKDLKKAVRYHNLLNKEEVVLEAKKPKSFKDVKKKMKEEETPNKSTVKKGDMLTGKKEPIQINPELKS